VLLLLASTVFSLASLVSVGVGRLPVGTLLGVLLLVSPFVWAGAWLVFSRVETDKDGVLMISWGCSKEKLFGVTSIALK
jgi:hypothetical protein